MGKGLFNNIRVEQASRETIILKGSNGLVDYKDNAETNRMRDHLHRFNAFLDKQEITLPDITPRETQMHFKRSFKYEFHLGGRFYGHWVITLKKEKRKELLFNNEPVCELD